jgi:hypothetical protein
MDYYKKQEAKMEVALAALLHAAPMMVAPGFMASLIKIAEEAARARSEEARMEVNRYDEYLEADVAADWLQVLRRAMESAQLNEDYDTYMEKEVAARDEWLKNRVPDPDED